MMAEREREKGKERSEEKRERVGEESETAIAAAGWRREKEERRIVVSCVAAAFPASLSVLVSGFSAQLARHMAAPASGLQGRFLPLSSPPPSSQPFIPLSFPAVVSHTFFLSRSLCSFLCALPLVFLHHRLSL